jgi:ketosteroid isomerase-like protein
MSLDTYKLHRLSGKSFDKLYTDHRKKWNKMVEKAADSVRACIPEGAAIKAGDVVAAVEHGIRISKEFEDHLAGEKLIQKYWAGWFAEYIVEQIYPHAEIKEAKDGGQNPNVKT